MSALALRAMEVPLHRFRRAHGEVVFRVLPPASRVPRMARALALGHFCARLVESGQAEDYTALARVLGISQARVAVLVQLTFLAPEIQEGLLLGTMKLSRRVLLRLARERIWDLQRQQVQTPFLLRLGA